MDNNADFLRWALVVSCVGSGMMAGLFASFSTFMMKALGSLERSEGVRAMQAINRLIVRPSFLLVFMGTAASSVVSAYVAYGATLASLRGCMWSDVCYRRFYSMFR